MKDVEQFIKQRKNDKAHFLGMLGMTIGVLIILVLFAK